MKLVIEGSEFSRELAGGDRGTEQTLAVMAELVRDAADSPLTRRVVDALVESVGPGVFTTARFDEQYMRAVYRYVKDSFVFKRDPAGLEELGLPDAMFEQIESGQGPIERDCDNVAVLGATLLAGFGFPAAFVAVATTEVGPWEHVFWGWVVGRQVIPFDPQEGIPPGEWAEAVKRAKYFLI